MDINEANDFSTSYEKRLRWKKINLPMTVRWSNLKKGCMYHIPPINGDKRKTIKILSINDCWLRYESKDEDIDVTTYNYIYNYDVAAKFMFPVNS